MTMAHTYKPGDWRDTEVRVHRASRIGDSFVPTFAIMGHTEMPDARTDAEMRRNLDIFEKDAKTIADALEGSLPGGTLDRLLGELLARKASQFIVNYNSLRESLQPLVRAAFDEGYALSKLGGPIETAWEASEARQHV